MKTAKWIIAIVLSAVLAGLIVNEKYLKNEESSEISESQNEVEIRKRYDDNGKLKSDAEYKNDMKNGIARNYYSDGSVHSEINYVNNVKNGESTWFYENGKPYRITLFKAGEKHGLQKKYYKSGKLMAEIPYENGNLKEGTIEYFESGKVISKQPKLQIKVLENLSGNFTCNVSLSEKVKKPKIYMALKNGFKQEAKEMSSNLYQFNITREYLNSKSIIYAEIKTSLRNPMLLSATVDVK